MKAMRRAALLLATMVAAPAGWAAEARVAVAANFTEPAKAIAAVLKKTSGHTLKLSFGATGAFYTQIRNGAPFDLLLAADEERPALLEQEGLAVPGSRFTYAIGKLVLWSVDPAKVDDRGEILKSSQVRKVAYANPKTAPYGAAAVQVLEKMGLAEPLKPRLVQGDSIGQTFSFVKTGNADIGFVALSQVLDGGKLREGSMWVIPPSLYRPIRQDAVLLQRGQHNQAALELIRLLRSPDIRDLIRSYGYDL